LLKASGSQWTHGTAIYYLSQMEPTWLPFLREAFKQPLVTTGMTYFAVLHQVLFPVAMFSRFKLLWVALGIGFNVGLAVFMGLLPSSEKGTLAATLSGWTALCGEPSDPARRRSSQGEQRDAVA